MKMYQKLLDSLKLEYIGSCIALISWTIGKEKYPAMWSEIVYLAKCLIRSKQASAMQQKELKNTDSPLLCDFHQLSKASVHIVSLLLGSFL